MLNVVLWLTEICVCCAFVPEYNPTNSIWKRSQSLSSAETQNCSSNQPHLKSSNSLSTDILNSEIFPYRRVPRLTYPCYFNDTKIPKLGFLPKKPRDKILPSNDNFEMTVATYIDKIYGKDKNIWNVGNCDGSNKIGSENLRKDSLVISPTLLIGRKNNSGFKNSWVLTNSPTNVYIGDDEVNGRNVCNTSSIEFNVLNDEQKETDHLFNSKKHNSLDRGYYDEDFSVKRPHELVKPLILSKLVGYKRKKTDKRLKDYNISNTQNVGCGKKRLNMFQIYDGEKFKLNEPKTDIILKEKLNHRLDDDKYLESNCTGRNSVSGVKKCLKLKTPFDSFNVNKVSGENSDGFSLKLDEDSFNNIVSDINIFHKLKIPVKKSRDSSKVKYGRGLNNLKGGSGNLKNKKRCKKIDNIGSLPRKKWWVKNKLYQKLHPALDPKYIDFKNSRRPLPDTIEDPNSLDSFTFNNFDQYNEIYDFYHIMDDSDEDEDLSFYGDDKAERDNDGDNNYDTNDFAEENIYQSRRSKFNLMTAHPIKSCETTTDFTFGPSDLPPYIENEELKSNNQCVLNKVLLKPSSFLNESTLTRDKAQHAVLSETDLVKFTNHRTTTFPVSKSESVTDAGLLVYNNLSQVVNYDFASLLRDPDLLLDTILVSPMKTRCEKDNRKRCVCSPHGIAEFFSNVIDNLSDNKLFKKLIIFSCTGFVPIQDCYRIASDMKPRLIFNKRRELVEADGGPDEISPSEFDELIMNGLDEEGGGLFVFPSTTVEIPCFTSDQMKLSPNTQDSAHYEWTHSNKQAITEGRILEDANHKGTLIIQDVTLSDSDNYICRVNYIDPDDQVLVSKTFVHTVTVVVLPRLALHSNVHYNSTGACDQELLEMFELYLPQQIESAICNCDGAYGGRTLCSVEIHNPVCFTTTQQDSTRKTSGSRPHWRSDYSKTRWFRQILKQEEETNELSVNYELDLNRISNFVPVTTNWSMCSPQCQQKIYLKTIEILRDSFLDSLLLPVRTNTADYRPLADSIDIKMMIACDEGLELLDGFCCPCKKHFFSDHGATVCQPCPPGTYQDSIGSKSCIPCPHPFRDNCFTLASFINLTSILIIGVCCVVTTVLSVYCCGYNIILKMKNPNETHNELKTGLRKEKPEPLPPDFDEYSDK